MPSRSACHNGFTLIELLVTLVILALAAGIVLARTDGLSMGSDAHADAWRFAAFLQRSRAEAIRTGTPVLLQFSPENLSVSARTGNGLQTIYQWDTGLDVSMESGDAHALVFTPTGTVSNALRVGVRDAVNRYQVVLNPVTGAVRVER